MPTASIPKIQVPIVDSSGGMTKAWYKAFSNLPASTVAIEALQDQVDALETTVANIPAGFTLKATNSITSYGSSAGGALMLISLVGDTPSPNALSFYGSVPANDAGWYSFSSNFANSAGELDLSQPTIASGGSISLLGFDVYGRLSESAPATSDNLPEGLTNLYDTPIVATALTNLSAQIVVSVDGSGNAYTPNLANPVDLGRIAGVTLHAAAEGAPIQIVTQRSFTESAWGWSPGRIYCATTGGTLTQTPPTSPSAIVEVARAISPTTIRVGIQPAIII